MKRILAFLFLVAFFGLFNLYSNQKASIKTDREEILLNYSLDPKEIKLKEVFLSQSAYSEPFYKIDIDGYMQSASFAKPQLPQLVEIVEIPFGSEVDIEILQKNSEILPLNLKYKLLPKQYPAVNGDTSTKAREFLMDKELYSKDEFYGQNAVSIKIIGQSRDRVLAKITISPLEYNPVQNLLKLHKNIKYKLILSGADYAETARLKSVYGSLGSAHASLGSAAASFGSAYDKAETDNTAAATETTAQHGSTHEAASVPLFQNSQAEQIANKVQGNIRRLAPKKQLSSRGAEKYIIVSCQKYKETLKEFVDFKTKQGFEVVEVYKEDAIVGGTTATKISTYLKSLYNSATEENPAQTYVLLVGDANDIPTFKTKDRDGHGWMWDNEGDLYYVEYTGDYLPDAYVGRFPVSSQEELSAVISKTIEMAQIEPSNADFLRNHLLIAGHDAGSKNDRGESFSEVLLNPTVDYIYSNYYESNADLNCLKYKYPESTSKYAEIKKKISEGLGFLMYTGHGLYTQFYSPTLYVSDVDNFTNKSKYGLVVGNCCQTAQFVNKDICLGAKFVVAKDKGAVVYVGATAETGWEADYFWAIGFKNGSLTNPKYDPSNHGFIDQWRQDALKQDISVGELVYTANCNLIKYDDEFYARAYFEMYEIFGDPSYRPFDTKLSKCQISLSENDTMTPRVNSFVSAPYAKITLLVDDKILFVQNADQDGLVQIDNLEEHLENLCEKGEAVEALLYATARNHSDNYINIYLGRPKDNNSQIDSLSVFAALSAFPDAGATIGSPYKALTLQPEFDPNILNYKLDLEFEDSVLLFDFSLASVLSVSSPSSPYEYIPKVGTEIVEIEVVAEDSSKSVYQIEYTRKEFVGLESSLKEKTTVRVFPNPAKDYLQIESSAKFSSFRLLDLKGNAVYVCTKSGDRHRIVLENIETGIYILDIDIEGQSIKKRIVIL